MLKNVEDVDTFTYLGAMVNKTGGATEDINHRLSLARNAFAVLSPLWKSSRYSRKTKIRVFNSYAICLSYYNGAEMWKLKLMKVISPVWKPSRGNVWGEYSESSGT